MSAIQTFPWQDVLHSERAWCESVVAAYGAPGIVLTESTLDLRVLCLFSHTTARTLGALALGVVAGELYIASTAPLADEVVRELARSHGHPLVVLLAAPAILPGAIDAAYAATRAGGTRLPGVRARSESVHLEIVRGVVPSVFDWLEPISNTCGQ